MGVSHPRNAGRETLQSSGFSEFAGFDDQSNCAGDAEFAVQVETTPPPPFQEPAAALKEGGGRALTWKVHAGTEGPRGLFQKPASPVKTFREFPPPAAASGAESADCGRKAVSNNSFGRPPGTFSAGFSPGRPVVGMSAPRCDGTSVPAGPLRAIPSAGIPAYH
jgi:hypothetical protein